MREADLQDMVDEAKAISDIDFVAYQGVYEKLLKLEGVDLLRLEEAVDKLSARCPIGVTNQPPLGGKATTTGQYLVLLKDAHVAVDQTIFKEVLEVVQRLKLEKNLGLEFVKGPDKIDDRTREKAQLCYKRNFADVKDFRRANVNCATVADMVLLVEEITNTPGLDVVRVKNRLHTKYNAKGLSAGYRDLQLNIRTNGETKIIWELQLHMKEMEKVKHQQNKVSDASGRTGHGRYKARRELLERIELLRV